MKTSTFKRGLSAFMALVLCLSLFSNISITPASAAGTQSEVGIIGFPRDGDEMYHTGTWGHDGQNLMNGWTALAARQTIVRTVGSYVGPICYCLEPGVPINAGDKLTDKDESYWDNYPSQYNNTIEPDDIKLLIGRIMQYGYTGNVATSWRTQNEGSEKLANAVATQILIWETVVGERDAEFNKVSTGGYDAVLDQISQDHPLRSKIMGYYNTIAANVQTHSKLPTFFARSMNRAIYVEPAWNGEKYVATLTDYNNVLSNYTFSTSYSGISFSVSGNQLTITSSYAPTFPITVTAVKNNSQRQGIVTWTDGYFGQSGGLQDLVSYTQSVTDPIRGYLFLRTTMGSMQIVKTSEDGNVEGISFTITGNGINRTVQTNSAGEIKIDDLVPGTYTVTEQSFDEYQPQDSRQITVVAGLTSTVTFNNKLRRGDIAVQKTAEDGLIEGVKFHLYGTTLSGDPVDEYAVTDDTGRAYFRNLPIGTGYTLEEVDVPVRYVIPDDQTAAIEWKYVTRKTFENQLKKWNATVTKRDSQTGSAQADGSLAGAVYGVYQGDQLIDTYTTDASGQFTTDYYACGDNWSIREITPSEGYLLDAASHHVGAEPGHYTAEYNSVSMDVTERVIKGNIAIIKHTDDGGTQVETPEAGAEFNVYLKSAGSYDAAKASERDHIVCDGNGYAQTKDLPYGVYTVHQTRGWEGRELVPDFDVYVAEDGKTYRYLINDAIFKSYVKIVKTDAESGKTIPYAGAGFQLYRSDGSKITQSVTYPDIATIDTFYTNDEGFLITPEALVFGPGYDLIEVAAPQGYVLDSTPVYFDVTEDNSIKGDATFLVEVTKANMAQKGTVKISKTGEVFSTVTENGGVYQPVYEVKGLPVGLYAAEDLTAADGKVIPADGLVEIVSINEDGQGTVSTDLPLGSYYYS